MKIGVGTMSPVKIKAIERAIAPYEFLGGVEVLPRQVKSGVSDQPITLGETVRGAKNRAKRASKDCDMGIGIESGLMRVPGTKTGFMNASVCAIYDGNKYHLGLASGFEYPKEVTRLMVEEGIEGSHAQKMAGLTDKDKIGYEEGAIGLLTKGRVGSVEYYIPAVVNAITHLENPDFF